eukprot:TRINITY_DN40317_c0_g1_i2.p2 TRINITY_DN40317_c0_g1~~TRINITY_DN40317_c0_g1_i2.p2  ORF type:complete len:297 (+),score=49.58 TRINITY_DN40317_c0_g1_i2:65-892(+)
MSASVRAAARSARALPALARGCGAGGWRRSPFAACGSTAARLAAGALAGGAAAALQWRSAAQAAEAPLRVPFAELVAEIRAALEGRGVPAAAAAECAVVFAQTQRDGVLSHGLARVPSLLTAIDEGKVDPHAHPETVAAFGALERWDGKEGIGVANARAAMRRAVQLAGEHGVGAVALRNTGHWMRGGAYGLQAAEAGCIGVCWTNTCPVMAPWGSAPGSKKLGNNPLVLCVPREGGAHVLMDMACSQYARGASMSTGSSLTTRRRSTRAATPPR